MTATQKSELIARRLNIPVDAAHTLRRAELVLHRWAELECGDGNTYGSWAIERDENGEGAPFMVHHHYRHGQGKDTVTRTPIADREAGALRRVQEVCAAHGLYYFHQGDPRGCQLYVAREPLNGSNYTNGFSVCV